MIIFGGCAALITIYFMFVTLLVFLFQQVSEDISHACLFLARYHLNLKNIDDATYYARRATEHTEVCPTKRILARVFNTNQGCI